MNNEVEQIPILPDRKHYLDQFRLNRTEAVRSNAINTKNIKIAQIHVMRTYTNEFLKITIVLLLLVRTYTNTCTTTTTRTMPFVPAGWIERCNVRLSCSSGYPVAAQ